MMTEPEDNEIGYCAECGAPIGNGRPDRKFCSPRCKSRWHNHKRNPQEGRVEARVLRILRRNREILAKLTVLKITTIDLTTLCQLGFNPRYSTSYELLGRRIHQYTCFEFSYEMTEKRIRQLVRITLELPDMEDEEDKPTSGRPPSSGDP